MDSNFTIFYLLNKNKAYKGFINFANYKNLVNDFLIDKI